MTASNLDTYLALHRAGRYAEAETGYRLCLDHGVQGAAFPLAVVLLQQRKYAEAVDVLEPLASANPGDAQVATNFSIALRNSGRVDDALRIARHAVDISSMDVGACNALGLAALEAGQVEEALQAFEAGLRLAPGQVALELHRGKALRAAGRTSEALDAFQRIVARAPQIAQGWHALGSTQAALGMLEAALTSIERARALAPDDVEIALEYAVLSLQSGSTDAAAKRLADLLQAHPGEARAWRWLGLAHLKQKDFEAARTAFEKAGTLNSDDHVVAHFRAALSGELPENVESDYVRALFDDFADRFESTLVERLAYATPRKLAHFLRTEGVDDGATVLDLGCGTGLMGVELVRSGRCIDGIDLSPRMLDHARAKNVYRDLHAAELLEFLRRAEQQWDLVVAADVFVYVADLRPIFHAVFERLAPDGAFAFSIECSASDATELLPETGRYRHSPQRLEAVLRDVGFTALRREAVVLRMEAGAPVAGELLLGRRARR